MDLPVDNPAFAFPNSYDVADFDGGILEARMVDDVLTYTFRRRAGAGVGLGGGTLEVTVIHLGLEADGAEPELGREEKVAVLGGGGGEGGGEVTTLTFDLRGLGPEVMSYATFDNLMDGE
jgi:hypothetical protein